MQHVVFLMVALLAMLPGQLPAASSDWAVNEQARTRLVSSLDSVAPGQTVIRVGWQVDLAPGWKTYWRAPGEAGLPPRFDWSESENVAAVDVAWPTPERMTAYGFDSIVYGDNVVLPIRIRLHEPGQPVSLQLKTEYMVCEEICIPHEAHHDLTLAAGPGGKSPEAGLIEEFEARVPLRQSALGVAVQHQEGGPWIKDLTVSDQGLELIVVKGKGGIADIFVDGPPALVLGRVRAKGEGPDDFLKFHVPLYGADPVILADQELGLVLVGGSGHAVEWRGYIKKANSRCASDTVAKSVDQDCANR